MNCIFCGEEYEFSFGHHCPVMQGESKQPMPQPDLVSKLREVIAKWRESAAIDREESVSLNARLQAGETVTINSIAGPYKDLREGCADELESLIGLEGQTANECQYCNRGIERKLVGVHWVHPIGQEQFECRYSTLDVPTCGPSQPETDFGTAGEVIAGLDGIIAHNSDVALAHSAFLSPSTPIVPGTAGLSAENIKLKIGSRFYDREPYSGAWDEPFNVVCEVLNATLTERPAPAGEVPTRKD